MFFQVLCLIAAIVSFIVGVALLITGTPSGKLLWEIIYIGLAFLAASFLPYERWRA